MDNMKALGFLRFAIERNIKNLFKGYLVILESLVEDNCISREYYERLRKQVLSGGNDALREIEEYLEKFDIDFKN